MRYRWDLTDYGAVTRLVRFIFFPLWASQGRFQFQPPTEKTMTDSLWHLNHRDISFHAHNQYNKALRDRALQRGKIRYSDGLKGLLLSSFCAPPPRNAQNNKSEELDKDGNMLTSSRPEDYRQKVSNTADLLRGGNDIWSLLCLLNISDATVIGSLQTAAAV